MLKAIRKMMNKPVTLDLIDRKDNYVEKMGGGIGSQESRLVLILRGLDSLWLAAEWRHSGEIVIVPIVDVLCIASDI